MPKPYMHLGNEPLLRRTVRAFLDHPLVDGVRVVIRREHHAYYKKAIEGLTLFPCVIGGDSRQESVLLGLESLLSHRPEYVLIHDIARPMAHHALLTRILTALEVHEAAIPALPVTDTVKRGANGFASGTLDRQGLYTVQTPQGFHFD